MKSASEESTEKLIESLHAPRKKPEMARSKKPEFAPKPDLPQEKPEEEIRKTKKDQQTRILVNLKNTCTVTIW